MKRCSLFIVAIVLCLMFTSVYAQSDEKLSKLELEVAVKTDSGSISGSLLMPKKPDQPPVVLIISGSGPTDRNGNSGFLQNNALRKLAYGLARNGIASVRYDKRGLAGSAKAAYKEEDLTIDRFIRDAVYWLDTLNKDSRFSNVFVAGHSEGSLIGMMAIQQSKAAGFISIAGVGVPADKILEKQLASQSEDLAKQAVEIMEQLKAGKSIPQDSIPPILLTLYRSSIQQYLTSWFRLDPAREIARLNCPVYILQGTTDLQVSQDNAELLNKSAKHADLRIIEGMNHVLKDAPMDRSENLSTYGNKDLPLSDGVLKGVTKFIKSILK